MNSNKNPVIIAIEFKNEDELNEALQIAKHKFSEVNEDYRYCVLRERGKEALTCIEMKIPFIAYDAKEHEIIYSNVKEIPENSLLFLRKSTNRYPDKLGYKYVFDHDDEKRVEAWPNLLEQDCPFKKRTIDYMEHDSFARLLEEKSLLLPVFIKTADKGRNEHRTLHHIIDSNNINLFNAERNYSFDDYESKESKVTFKFGGEEYFNEYLGEMQRTHYSTHSLEGDFILSEVMDIEEDGLSDNGKIEYRCYVINNKLANLSRYVDYKHIDVPLDAKNFAKGFIEAYEGIISDSYVLDIAKTNKGYQIVEINPVPNSGRYLNNSPSQIFNMVIREFGNNTDIDLKKESRLIEKPIEIDNEDIFDLNRLSFD